MKDNLIKDVIQEMLPYLNNAQNKKLQEILQYVLVKYEVTKTQDKIKETGFYRTISICKTYRRMF